LPEIETLLEEAGIENGETLIVAREISRNGRSVGRVNGRAMPIFFLKELGGLLVESARAASAPVTFTARLSPGAA